MSDFDAICDYCGKNLGKMKDNVIALSLHIKNNHEKGRGKLKKQNGNEGL